MCGSVAQLVVAPNQRWVRLGLNPIQAGFFSGFISAVA